MNILEVSISILIGIASGIITAVILGLATVFFGRVVLPWFRHLVYRGVKVDGNWSHKQTTQVSPTKSMTFEVSLDLEQKAHEVTGTFFAKTTAGEEEIYSNYFTLRGEIRDNYLLFTYSAQRKDRTGTGAFLLRVANGGKQLSGSAIFTPDRSVDDFRVETRQQLVFKRS
ncbi:hypothetical protein JNK62_03320 [bacterium]|nr:hypothetical protein [bacterium]